MKRSCKHCAKTFEPKAAGQTVCSFRCSRALVPKSYARTDAYDRAAAEEINGVAKRGSHA